MMGGLISEQEALRLLFAPGARPSLPAFQRMRRELDLPHVLIGRKVCFDFIELKEHLERHHHVPLLKEG